MKTNTALPAQDDEQKSNEPLFLKKIKTNKSHAHTLFLANNQNIGVASNVNPNSSTEDFLAADVMSNPTLIKSREKRWVMDLTIRLLKAFNHDDFHGCITFIEQHTTDDIDTLNYAICCETFYFGDDNYQVSLPGKIYKSKTKAIESNSYKYVKNLHEITSLDKATCKLTHNITDNTTPTLHLSPKDMAATFTQRVPAHFSDNTSALIVPLDNMDENTCISAAIFTSSKKNSIACDTSTFFYSIFKEALKVRNRLVKLYEEVSLNKGEAKSSPKSTVEENTPDTTIEKISSISDALEVSSTADQEVDSPITASKSPVSCTNKTKETAADQYLKKHVSYLQEDKDKLLFFKKIYHKLYVMQRGYKSSSFLESPDALYLSIEYLERLGKDDETKGSRRQKAWALAKKYFSSDNNIMLQKEIREYAKDNSYEVTKYIPDIITTIPGIFSLFFSSPSSNARTDKKPNHPGKSP